MNAAVWFLLGLLIAAPFSGDFVAHQSRVFTYLPALISGATSKLHKWADNKLRGELTLRAMALKELHLDRASGWNSSTPLEQLLSKIEGLSMAEQFSLTSASIEGLPGRLVAVYKLWKEGEDLRGMYSRATFYRYRSELLKQGIDIAIRQPPKATNVIPLVRVLRPEAIAQVPEWAINTPLYFEKKG